MNKLIRLEDVLAVIDRRTVKGKLQVAREVLKLPTIEPQRKRGKWIEYDNSHCECPFCHEEWSYFNNEVEHFNYCPNCGADMREPEDIPMEYFESGGR